MKTCGLTLLLLSSLFFPAAHAQEATAESSDPNQLFEPREFVAADGQTLKYRLLKPANFDPAVKYPLVIFLHGAGERGMDNKAQLKHCLGEFCKPQRRQDFPCYVLAPQCPKGEKWSDVDWSQEKVVASPSTSAPLQQTFDVVDSMLEDAAIDKNSVYICGLSMGGFGTWDALARRPDFFAAAIPICGGGDTTTASKFPSVPIWCFHGDQDKTVNVERSREMVAALKKAGGEPRYTEYPGVGHDSWTQTFADEATFRWLFGQRRTPAPR